MERDLLAAERETERLARLLTELLTLARERERPEPQPVSLARVAARAPSAGRPRRSAPGHRLRACGDGEPVVEATDADLAVILDNLVENALRYSPPETTVTIEWGAEGDTALLAVLDEGPGIAPEERERVFERFFRGEASRGGTRGHGSRAVGGRGAGAALGRRGRAHPPRRRNARRAAAAAQAGASEPNPDRQLHDALPGPG